MSDDKLKLIYIGGMFLVGVTFLGLSFWLMGQQTEPGHDPTGMIASYVLLGVGCVIFIAGIVFFFIRHDLDA